MDLKLKSISRFLRGLFDSDTAGQLPADDVFTEFHNVDILAPDGVIRRRHGAQKWADMETGGSIAPDGYPVIDGNGFGAPVQALKSWGDNAAKRYIFSVADGKVAMETEEPDGKTWKDLNQTERFASRGKVDFTSYYDRVFFNDSPHDVFQFDAFAFSSGSYRDAGERVVYWKHDRLMFLAPTTFLPIYHDAKTISAVSIDDGAPAYSFTVASAYAYMFDVGDSVVVAGSTGNDGTYTVVAVEQSGADVVLFVSEAIVSPTVDGTLKQQYRVKINNDANNAEGKAIWDSLVDIELIGANTETTTFPVNTLDASEGLKFAFCRKVGNYYFALEDQRHTRKKGMVYIVKFNDRFVAEDYYGFAVDVGVDEKIHLKNFAVDGQNIYLFCCDHKIYRLSAESGGITELTDYEFGVLEAPTITDLLDDGTEYEGKLYSMDCGYDDVPLVDGSAPTALTLVFGVITKTLRATTTGSTKSRWHSDPAGVDYMAVNVDHYLPQPIDQEAAETGDFYAEIPYYHGDGKERVGTSPATYGGWDFDQEFFERPYGNPDYLWTTRTLRAGKSGHIARTAIAQVSGSNIVLRKAFMVVALRSNGKLYFYDQPSVFLAAKTGYILWSSGLYWSAASKSWLFSFTGSALTMQMEASPEEISTSINLRIKMSDCISFSNIPITSGSQIAKWMYANPIEYVSSYKWRIKTGEIFWLTVNQFIGIGGPSEHPEIVPFYGTWRVYQIDVIPDIDGGGNWVYFDGGPSGSSGISDCNVECKKMSEFSSGGSWRMDFYAYKRSDFSSADAEAQTAFQGSALSVLNILDKQGNPRFFLLNNAIDTISQSTLSRISPNHDGGYPSKWQPVWEEAATDIGSFLPYFLPSFYDINYKQIGIALAAGTTYLKRLGALRQPLCRINTYIPAVLPITSIGGNWSSAAADDGTITVSVANAAFVSEGDLVKVPAVSADQVIYVDSVAAVTGIITAHTNDGALIDLSGLSAAYPDLQIGQDVVTPFTVGQTVRYAVEAVFADASTTPLSPPSDAAVIPDLGEVDIAVEVYDVDLLNYVGGEIHLAADVSSIKLYRQDYNATTLAWGEWLFIESFTKNTDDEFVSVTQKSNAPGVYYDIITAPGYSPYTVANSVRYACAMILLHKSRLVLIGDLNQDNSSVLLYSALDMTDSIPPTNIREIEAGDGERLVAGWSEADLLYLFKFTKIYAIAGDTPDGQIVNVNLQNGTRWKNMITSYGGVVYFVNDNGIYKIEGLKDTPITDDGQVRRLFDRFAETPINREYVDSVGFTFVNHQNGDIFWCIPTGTSTEANFVLVYNARYGFFRTWSFRESISAAAVVQDVSSGEIRTLVAGQSGKMYELSADRNDVGKAIEWYVKTKEYNIDTNVLAKSFKVIKVHGKFLTGLNVRYSVDGIEYEGDVAIRENSSGRGDAFVDVWQQDGRSNAISVEIGGSGVNDEQTEIDEIAIGYERLRGLK